MEGKILTEKLLAYAREFLHLKELDVIYTRNLLLREFGLKEPAEDADVSDVKNMSVPDELVAAVESYARENGLIAIADIKRNDIGSTAAAYSRAYIGATELAGGVKVTPFESDFVTVNGYLGSDGVKPFVADCEKNDKGIFVLVKTSNPASGELQDKALGDKETLYDAMADLVDDWGKNLIGKYGYSSVGAVVGATHKEQAARIRAAHPHLFFLIPGYGAQGGKAEDLAVCFKDGIGGIVNSSRGILCAYKKEQYAGLNYKDAALKAAIDMQKDLTRYIK